MCAYKQNRVSAAIWPWYSHGVTHEEPHRGALRKQAVCQFCVVAAIGLVVFFLLRHRIVGTVVVGLALVLLLTGLFLPRVFQALERFGRLLGKWVGAGLTWLLLVPFFYLCFLPGHWLLSASKKDPLRLRLSEDEPTYWTHRPPVLDVNRFKSQY